MTGDCEVSFHASGQAALYHVIPILVAPNTIRDMIGWVVDECIGEARTGGYVTRNISRTTEWLIDPAIDLPEFSDWNDQRKVAPFRQNALISSFWRA